jgi:TolA-binding protein
MIRNALHRALGVTCAIALAGTLTSCSTMGGGSDTDKMVAATYASVKKLDSQLTPQVDRLNTTTTELNAHVEETDRQTRALQSSIEDQQVKLEQMEKKLDSLTNTLYKQLNLSPPSAQSRVNPLTPQSVYVDERKVEVVEPAPGPEATDSAPPEPVPDISSPPAEVDARATTPVKAETTPSQTALDLYMKARADFDAQRYDAAVTKFTEFLDTHKDTELGDRAQYTKGLCYFYMDQFDKAIGEFDTLRTKYPDSDRVPNGLYYQANSHLKMKQREKAKRVLSELVEKYPMSQPAEKAAPVLKQLQETN